jgi:hypothetical protein
VEEDEGGGKVGESEILGDGGGDGREKLESLAFTAVSIQGIFLSFGKPFTCALLNKQTRHK